MLATSVLRDATRTTSQATTRVTTMSSHPKRARVACKTCRQAKVRCSLDPIPCPRCKRLRLNCTVDPQYRRTNSTTKSRNSNHICDNSKMPSTTPTGALPLHKPVLTARGRVRLEVRRIRPVTMLKLMHSPWAPSVSTVPRSNICSTCTLKDISWKEGLGYPGLSIPEP